jgi:uncharacterized tellurite resistance protein B-like protein
MNEIVGLLLFAIAVILFRSRKKKKALALQELNASLMQQAEERRKVQEELESARVIESVKAALVSSIKVGSGSAFEDRLVSSSDSLSESQTCWYPPGQPAEVAGYKLPAGMVYVGTSLRAISGFGPDAALLDPTKPINVEEIDREGKSMGYWPSYSDIPPGNRAAYLEWLANGRRDPCAYIGYVFLFLYGLERRLLFDIKNIEEVKTELPVLLDEVKALIQVYGKVSGSFNNYATGLIDLLNLSTVQRDYTQATPPTTRSGWDFPRELKLALGTLAQEGKPVPVEWALSWVRCYPEVQLRTPAIRCAAEFDALFAVRYLESFADGLRIKPTKSRLKESHRPASPSLPSIEIILPDLPDVTKLSAPIQQLMKIVESVQLELEQYSRLVGQGKERRGVAALATLPAKIQPSELSEDAKAIIELIEKRMAQAETVIIPSSELIEHYNVKTLGKLTKQESILLADFLAKRGYGIEPDTRFGGVNLSSTSHCAIYRVNDVDVEPGSAFKSATVLLHLSVAMVKADGDVTLDEQRHLELHMEQALHLKTAERKRLSAHLQWLMADSPSLTSVKHRIQELEESQRRSLAQFLISVAGADGHISSSEIKILSKIYPLLGLEPDSVYSDVHSLSVADTGLVTVLRPDGPSKGFTIPKQQLQDADPTIGKIVLDTERIARIREKSLEASSLLNSVFDDNQSDISHDSVAEIVADENIYASGVLSGLDAKHSAFVRILMERDSWSRADVERLAQQHDLLTAGAIEAINEASFNVCGEALLECDDPIEVNAYAKKEIR